MKNKPTRRTVAIVATAIILGLALLAFLYSSSRDPFFHKKEFRSEDWLIGGMRVRGQMVASLLDKKILSGKTQIEVAALLGVPNSTFSNRIAYRVDIGQRFGFDPWSYILTIEFNTTNGVVSNVVLSD